jgi:potassium channel LctB
MKKELEENKKNNFHIKFLDFLFKRPLLKLIILLIIQFIIIKIPELVPDDFSLRLITLILGIIITIYFIAVIVHVARLSIEHLKEPKSLFHLIGAYVLLILVIIFISSILYNFVDLSHLGYIQYGNCNDNFNPSLIDNSPTISTDFFYFSAVTFFTVGYGDICPMGFARVISIIVAFMGHIVSVILVAVILNNYLRKRERR